MRSSPRARHEFRWAIDDSVTAASVPFPQAVGRGYASLQAGLQVSPTYSNLIVFVLMVLNAPITPARMAEEAPLVLHQSGYENMRIKYMAKNLLELHEHFQGEESNES